MRQQFEAQIRQLAQAGIATHVISNTEDVDALFTVARARDMPMVRFAAAFEDGLLAVGCPDGLPDELANLAVPIVVEPDVTEHANKPQPTNVNEKIALLAQRISENMPAPAPATTPDVSAQLSEIRDAIRALSQTPPDQILRDIQSQIEALAAQSASAGESQDLQQIGPAEDQLALGDPDDSEDLGQILTDLEAASVPAAPELDITPIMTVLLEIQAQISALSVEDSPVGTDVSHLLTAFEGRILAALAEQGNAHDPATATLIEGQANLQALVSDLPNRIVIPPVPVIDIAQQRQSFAQFATALSKIMGRFDDVLERLDHPTASELDPPFDIDGAMSNLRDGIAADHAAIVSDLREQIASLVPPLDIEGAMTNLRECIATDQAASLSDLREQITSFLPQTAPNLDLTAQRQSFAVFTTALAKAIARLESTADEMVAAMSSSIDDHETPNWVGSLDAAMADLRAEVETLLTYQSDAFSAVRSDIGSLADATASRLDIVQQDRRYAAYAAALSEALAKFHELTAVSVDDDGADTIDTSLPGSLGEPVEDVSDQTGDVTQAAKLEKQIAAFSTGAHKGIEDLRTDFAELIASQIRQKILSEDPETSASASKTA